METIMEVIGMENKVQSPIVLFIDIGQKLRNLEAREMLKNKAGEIGLNGNNSKFLFCTEEYPVERLYADIQVLNPLFIITVGYSAFQKLIPNAKGGILKNRGKIFKYDDTFLLLPTIHPNYIIQNPTEENQRIFSEDIRLGMKAAANVAMCKSKGEEFDYEHFSENLKNQGLQSNKAETEIITSYEQFVEFCKENVDPYKEIGYDVETNALPVMSDKHRIVGFSLASGKSKGCYVPLRALDFQIKKSDRELIRDKLKEILSDENKEIWVYNCMHEIPVTWNWNGYFMKNVKDLYIIAKLMNCGKRGIRGSMGLKNLCKINLGLEDWSKDLDDYFELLKNLDEPNKDNRIKLKAMMSKYYDGEELEKIIKAIEDLYEHLKVTGETRNDVLSYEYVPYKLIGRYGSLDASNMFGLRDFYYREMEKENKLLGIDMFKGFDLWQKHHIAGAILEMNGAYWNDEKAEELGKWCTETMKSSMKKLLLHPLTEKLLKKRFSYDFSIMLMKDFLSEIMRTDFVGMKQYKDSVGLQILTNRGEQLINQIIQERIEENKNKELRNINLQKELRRKLKTTEIERPIFVPEIKIDKRERKIVKLDTETFVRLAELQGFFRIQPYLFPNWFKGKMKEIESTDMTIEEMKGLVNITSTAKEFKDYLSGILITQDVKIAHFFCALCQYLDDPSFASWQIKSKEDEKFVTDVQGIMSTSDDFYDPEKFKLFKTLLTEFINNNVFSSYKLSNLLTASMKYKLEKLDSAAIEELYNYYGMLDMDINDNTTWSKEYEWMFNYKVFKKLSKVYTTYVYGASTGRNNVCYVNKKDLQSGDTFCRRVANYNDDYEERSKEGLDTILNSGFFVNGAATGRWQCLSGDTKISLLDGRNVPIKDLINEKDFYVYSYDFNKGHLVPGLCKGCQITGKNVPVMKITLDNGESLKCTLDHKLMKRNGHYIKAKDVVVGQSLMPLYRRLTSDGYEEILLTNSNKWIRTHHLVQQWKNGLLWRENSHVSHHKNFDKTNNDPRNLLRIDRHKHWKYHSKFGWKMQWMNPEIRKRWTERAKNTIIKLNKDPEFRKKNAIAVSKANKNITEETRKKYSELMTKNNYNPEYQAKAKVGLHEFFKDKERSKNFREKAKENIKICHKKREQNSEYKKNHSEAMKKFWHEMWYENTERAIAFREKRNHKVIKIEILEEKEDYVYDLYVEKYHNFALDCGIVVHNSGLHNISNGDPKNVYTSRFPGGTIMAPDYSGVEIKTIAAISGDETLLNAIRDGLDVHTLTASLIYKVPMEEVQKRQRALAKNATFHILYGGSTRSFANSYCKGDMNQAEEIINGYFNAYPRIKEYIERAHQQVTKYDKVTTRTNRFISIDKKIRDGKEDVGARLRESQNFPIQGSAEDCAGNTLYDICMFLLYYPEYVRNNDIENMKKIIRDENIEKKVITFLNKNSRKTFRSKPFCFIHDSIEMDVYPDELFLIHDVLDYFFNVKSSQDWDVPFTSDVTIGPSMGQEIEVEDLEVSEDYNEATFVLKGYLDDIHQLTGGWQQVYKLVDEQLVEGEEDKSEKISWGLMMSKLKAPIKSTFGKTLIKGKRKFHLILK